MRRVWTRLLFGVALFLVAVSAGYLTSSRLGADALRLGVAKRLGDLMGGEVTIEQFRVRLHLGVHLEGRNVRVYPRDPGAGLEARYVDAELDVLSTLLGGFRLRELRVDDLIVRIERDAAGDWSFPPLQAVAKPDEAPSQLRDVGWARSTEAVSRFLLERGIVADRVELRDARVRFVDWHPRGDRAAPVSLNVESLYGVLDHRWWSDEPELVLRGVVVDGRGLRSRIEFEGHRTDDALRLSAAVSGIEASLLRPYREDPVWPVYMAGRISGVATFETLGVDLGVLSFDGSFADLQLHWPRGDDFVRLGSPQVYSSFALEVAPSRLRLMDGHLETGPNVVEASGVVERPLRPASRARAAIDLMGADLEVARRVADSLPATDRETLLGLLEDVESAKIVRLGARGSTRVAAWDRILRGEQLELPPSFVLSVKIADMRFSGDIAALLLHSATAEWSGDRIDFRRVVGELGGVEIPRIDASVEGLSKLLGIDDEFSGLEGRAAGLPGLDPLVSLVRRWASGDPTAPEDDFAAPIDIELVAIDNPAILLPLRAAKIHIEDVGGNLHMRVREAFWGGVPVRGDALYVPGEPGHITVNLETLESDARPPPFSYPGPGVWAMGRITVRSEDRERPIRSVDGEFRFDGTRATVWDLRLGLQPSGIFEGRGSVDLASAEQLPVEVEFGLREGDLARLSEWVGLDAGVLTGKLETRGALAGELALEGPPLARMSGDLTLAARNGEIRRRMPLIVAVAHATEGFNPFAARDSVHFESLETVLTLDRGHVTTDSLMLEGPVRVFAQGEADLSVDPSRIDAVVGVFLFRQADLTLGQVPLLGELISDKGLVGAYYSVEGPLDEPEIDSLPGRTLAEGMPDIVKAPFRALRFLLSGSNEEAEDPQ